jgi:hypothetical protein
MMFHMSSTGVDDFLTTMIVSIMLFDLCLVDGVY